MPTRFNTNYLRLKDDDEFEELLRDICALEWGDPGTERNGRSGQSQKGVDVYGRPVWSGGRYYGVQCKLRPSQKQLTKREIEREVKEARSFPHKLIKLIFATDTPRDNRVQMLVDSISEREVSSGSFEVEIWFWPEIERRIGTYPHILVKYYRDQLTSLTNTEFLDRLVDRPLQVFSVRRFTSPRATLLEERLQFRGVRVATNFPSPVETKAVGHNDLLPDGVIFQLDSTVTLEENYSSVRFIADILSYERLVESSCPIFILAPPALQDSLKSQVQILHEQLERFQWLADSESINDIADRVFGDVFDYGYRRRAMIPTVNISARTRPNRPTSALLDLDWRSHLDTERHPSESGWDELFAPALRSMTEKLTSLREGSRIQVDCDLPLPSAIAMGFCLNLRVATLGVWARQMGKSRVKHLWLADAEPAKVEIEETWFKDSKNNAQEAILELTSGFSIHAAVETFAEQQTLNVDTWLQVHLLVEKDGGGIDEGQAVAFANHVGSLVRRLTSQGTRDFHLFLRLPSPLGIFLGQKLQACGRIHLYWFDNTNYSYKPACVLA